MESLLDALSASVAALLPMQGMCQCIFQHVLGPAQHNNSYKEVK